MPHKLYEAKYNQQITYICCYKLRVVELEWQPGRLGLNEETLSVASWEEILGLEPYWELKVTISRPRFYGSAILNSWSASLENYGTCKIDYNQIRLIFSYEVTKMYDVVWSIIQIRSKTRVRAHQVNVVSGSCVCKICLCPIAPHSPSVLPSGRSKPLAMTV